MMLRLAYLTVFVLNSRNPPESKHVGQQSPSHLRTHRFDSRDSKGLREEPHLESPGNFSCLATSHMCQTSPPTLHISHIPQECLLFLQGRENESNAALCLSLCAAPTVRPFQLVQFLIRCSHQFFCSLVESLASFNVYLCHVMQTIEKRPCAFISSVTVGILTKGLSSGPDSNHNIFLSASCFHRIHSFWKQRFPLDNREKTNITVFLTKLFDINIATILHPYCRVNFW